MTKIKRWSWVKTLRSTLKKGGGGAVRDIGSIYILVYHGSRFGFSKYDYYTENNPREEKGEEERSRDPKCTRTLDGVCVPVSVDDIGHSNRDGFSNRAEQEKILALFLELLEVHMNRPITLRPETMKMLPKRTRLHCTPYFTDRVLRRAEEGYYIHG
uniref:Uncharacterized protein n=1 Tax=Magnetococcus massalia (strain MO-1) TaxID=451514 RepID=A0A1S7LFY7_MAGMO|nr:protein of unknown function [Candidatus Magnetococcus massalia]